MRGGESNVIDFEFLKSIERKWQKKWEEAKLFEANVDRSKPKFFVTFPYPYVNGGPHIGGAFTAYRVDTYARFKRMLGFNVLYPQGFHATGEPILGAVQRLREGDKSQIEAFKLYACSHRFYELRKIFGIIFNRASSRRNNSFEKSQTALFGFSELFLAQF